MELVFPGLVAVKGNVLQCRLIAAGATPIPAQQPAITVDSPAIVQNLYNSLRGVPVTAVNAGDFVVLPAAAPGFIAGADAPANAEEPVVAVLPPPSWLAFAVSTAFLVLQVAQVVVQPRLVTFRVVGFLGGAPAPLFQQGVEFAAHDIITVALPAGAAVKLFVVQHGLRHAPAFEDLLHAAEALLAPVPAPAPLLAAPPAGAGAAAAGASSAYCPDSKIALHSLVMPLFHLAAGAAYFRDRFYAGREAVPLNLALKSVYAWARNHLTRITYLGLESDPPTLTDALIGDIITMRFLPIGEYGASLDVFLPRHAQAKVIGSDMSLLSVALSRAASFFGDLLGPDVQQAVMFLLDCLLQLPVSMGIHIANVPHLQRWAQLKLNALVTAPAMWTAADLALPIVDRLKSIVVIRSTSPEMAQLRDELFAHMAAPTIASLYPAAAASASAGNKRKGAPTAGAGTVRTASPAPQSARSASAGTRVSFAAATGASAAATGGAYVNPLPRRIGDPPRLTTGPAPCLHWLCGIPPCRDRTECVGTGRSRTKRPHGFASTESPASKAVYEAWAMGR
jgi:hypothetical protein